MHPDTPARHTRARRGAAALVIALALAAGAAAPAQAAPATTEATTTVVTATAKRVTTGKIKVTIKAPKAWWSTANVESVMLMTVVDGVTYPVGITAKQRGKVFTFSGVPAGKYSVAISGLNTAKRITVSKGRTSAVALTARTGKATISGVVRDRHGKVYEGVGVVVRDANGTDLGATSTDERGRYTIRGAVRGSYVVLADPADGNEHAPDLSWQKRGVLTKKRVTSRTTGTTTANITLARGTTVTGMVVDRTKRPLAGTTVYVVSADGWGEYVETDADGRWQVTGLWAGRWWVFSTHEDAGDEPTVRFTLRRGQAKHRAPTLIDTRR
ncbi:carboxypeptidase regulatory-like domain-containing protein [Flavimobilis sp. GY10621]|uniref:Carboxypeptidase regulatory-like domain-containing protein n=1 Tax=Flavimobilis rhizosphaerae TaxID=2775421 RepID=A0ABR9DMV3_9MICO|nr:carboxypeptidase-like regulatory domain-containing protein [Flavimobilis rhizosphaerae]MBD9698463.1 carboxypeptidase regulatory-like domain-containing protein [Flavimobilis rhizosphaerae]